MGIKYKSYRMFLLYGLLFTITILLTPSLSAQEYYADITITVDSSGFVTIEGLTNYPNLTVKNTERYTSKQQSIWSLNITKQDTFSDFVYALTLPAGSSINYIKSSGFMRIEENLGNLIIRGFGENESLSVVVQYHIDKKEEVFLQEGIVYLILFSAVVIVGILFLLLYTRERKTKKAGSTETIKQQVQDWKGLNHRQKQIMRILQERNTPLTQTDIQKELQIPKASVSRNIRGLEKKGLIEKETVGMSNLIRLKKP